MSGIIPCPEPLVAGPEVVQGPVRKVCVGLFRELEETCKSVPAPCAVV
jgi:hypothetical protein